MLGVYIHIPFCESKCLYCAFSSFVKDKAEQEKYADALTREIENFAKNNSKKVDTIYIGGGTPSLLSIDNIGKIIRAVKDNFDIVEDYEFTIECNPCSLTEEKLAFYKQSGINRLSMGIQSLENDKLKAIGRRHTREDAIEKLALAKRYFENVSVDMLIGLPNMEKESFLKQVTCLATSGIKHISAYMLQVEEGTPLSKMVQKNPEMLPDDDESVEAYEEMAKILADKAFNRYEVSNFALKGFESRHNMKYWTGEDYVGFGLGAHSYVDGERRANASTFEDYYAGKLQSKEKLTTSQKIEEHIMLGLRCQAGINKNFLSNLGYNIEDNNEFADLINRGILTQKEDIVTLNPDFYGVSNLVIVKLLPEIESRK